MARIREAHPDAITFNEACGVTSRESLGEPVTTFASEGDLPRRASRCIQPGDGGLFGDAVLTKAAVESLDRPAFRGTGGIEQRRWLCLTTRVDVDVCTTHLATRGADEVAANDPQCPLLRALPCCVARATTSSSRATSIVAPPVPLRASGPAPTGPRSRTPGVSSLWNGRAPPRPRPRWSPPRLPTMTSCWSGRASPHNDDPSMSPSVCLHDRLAQALLIRRLSAASKSLRDCRAASPEGDRWCRSG